MWKNYLGHLFLISFSREACTMTPERYQKIRDAAG